MRRLNSRLLGLPRDPERRIRWWVRFACPMVVVPLAVLFTLGLTRLVQLSCGEGQVACQPLASGIDRAGWLTLAAFLLSLPLGVLVARPDIPSRWLFRLIALLVVALPWLPVLVAFQIDSEAAWGWTVPAIFFGLMPLFVLWVWLGVWTNSSTSEPLRDERWRAALRAARLTRRMLGADRYRQLSQTGYVRVASTLFPERYYLVPRRTSPAHARVLVEEQGRIRGGLCVRPCQPLPDPEEATVHVLMLTSDEQLYLSIANFFPDDRGFALQATARRH